MFTWTAQENPLSRRFWRQVWTVNTEAVCLFFCTEEKAKSLRWNGQTYILFLGESTAGLSLKMKEYFFCNVSEREVDKPTLKDSSLRLGQRLFKIYND